MGVIAHTMEYQGGSVVSRLQPRNYSVFDFDEYRTMYEECFRDMRTALGIFPVDCCGSKEELEQKKEKSMFLKSMGKWSVPLPYMAMKLMI